MTKYIIDPASDVIVELPLEDEYKNILFEDEELEMLKTFE